LADTAPKPFVFVLMPFDAAFNDVYRLGIKPAAEGAGAYCERIDEQIFAESILARIYNQIAKADLIVADMTGRNPNVFYEVGYAHALGKTVILLTKNAADIPFDLKHYPHIIYADSIAGMKDNLAKRIAYHLANPEKKEELAPTQLDFTISGTKLDAGVCIDVPIESGETAFELKIGVHNPSDTVVKWDDRVIGLILPKNYVPSHINVAEATQLPDGRMLHNLGTVYNLLPHAWHTLSLNLSMGPGTAILARGVPAELTVFSPAGPHTTKFSLNFVQSD
jgi:hypothetical protein